MRDLRIIYIALLAVLLASCADGLKQQAAQSNEFFAGEFVYFADAASMVDCATGTSLPVSNAGAYLDAERRYLSLDPTPQERIYIEFIGHVAQEPKMEGGGTQMVVVIDSLIGFDRTVLCNPEYVLTGVYEASSRDGKRILRLMSDYTYTEAVFPSSQAAQESNGRWFLTARMELALVQAQPEMSDSISTFEIVTPQQSLAKNSGGEPLCYTKVYL